MDEPIRVSYNAEATGIQFHNCDDFFRGVMGPVGSGKSSMCAWELFHRARCQRVHNGIRKSRWAIIRNTYPELKDTTLNTFTSWVPEMDAEGYSFSINRQPPMHGTLKMKLADGTRVETEYIFLALDTEEDVKKLKSLELTGAWVNEAGEIPWVIMKMLQGRVRRYPAVREGGYAWSGIIADTNPPDDEHWWYKMAEIEKPKNWRFWNQPPAIIPMPKKRPEDPTVYVPNNGQGPYPPAENVKNQNAGFNYWMDQLVGATPQFIKVFLMGQYGSTEAGKPVYPEYNDDLHCAKAKIEVFRGLPLYLGWDFGLTPCVAFVQVAPNGPVRTIEEICSEEMGIRQFANNIVKPHLRNEYAGMEIISVGDPAGAQRSQVNDETTCIQELQNAGIPTMMARTQNFLSRREAVAGFLNRLSDGKPCFRLSPECKILRKGFISNYRYKKMRTSLGERFTDDPEKLHPWSDIHDALQYICMHIEGGSSENTNRNTPANQRREVKKKSWKGCV